MSEENKNKTEGQETGDEQKIVEELENKVKELEEDKNSLTGEVKDIRQSRKEKEEQIELLEEQIKTANEANANPDEGASVVEAVRLELAKANTDRAKANRKVALEKFVTENKEYHPDNDTTGMIREALERGIKRFSQEGIVEVEDFISVIADAHRLLRRNDTNVQDESSTNIETPSSSSSQSNTSDNDGRLTELEQRLVKSSGFSVEKFIELKKSNPEFVEGLLEHVK